MVEEIWENFLNPDVLRKRLLTSGLFLIAFELLIDSVEARLKEFYSDHRSLTTDWQPSKKYKEKVLSLDPKGKGDVFRSSLAWLQNIGVISGVDRQNVWKLKRARNSFAHELRHLAGSGNRPDFEMLFPQLVDLIVKIDRWWIINVEIETDPDFSGKEICESEVTPGSQVLLQIATKVALGEDDDAWELYNMFVASQT